MYRETNKDSGYGAAEAALPRARHEGQPVKHRRNVAAALNAGVITLTRVLCIARR